MCVYAYKSLWSGCGKGNGCGRGMWRVVWVGERRGTGVRAGEEGG